MSSVYNLEPQPTAKVLLKTSSGDIVLELFAKQTPLACRNFLQHCLNGYYDSSIFHRLVPGFILQGGDPTGTGAGGESSFDVGEPFADEFHPRLKFNRRGLLGMANTGKKHDNASQFFITLDKAEELTGKSTLFGRIVGDTIYNLMKMGDAELADPNGDRPLYPTRITGSEVLVNPFDDMLKSIVKLAIASEVKEKKKPKRKAGKALLSFQADAEAEDAADVSSAVKKMRYNPALVDMATAPTVDIKQNVEPLSPEPVNGRIRDDRQEIARPQSPQPEVTRELSPERRRDRTSPEKPSLSPSPPPAPRLTALERTNREIEALKKSMRRPTQIEEPVHSRTKSALANFVPANALRGRKRNGKASHSAAERHVWDAFNDFRAKLEGVPTSGELTKTTLRLPLSSTKTQPEPVADAATATARLAATDDDEATLCDLHFIAGCLSCRSWEEEVAEDARNADEENDWMAHSLSFAKDRLGKDLEWKRKNEEELMVIDPREKAKELGVAKAGGGPVSKAGGRWEKVDEKERRRR